MGVYLQIVNASSSENIYLRSGKLEAVFDF